MLKFNFKTKDLQTFFSDVSFSTVVHNHEQKKISEKFFCQDTLICKTRMSEKMEKVIALTVETHFSSRLQNSVLSPGSQALSREPFTWREVFETNFFIFFAFEY